MSRSYVVSHPSLKSCTEAMAAISQSRNDGYVDGVGLYEYVGGDPVDLVDPEGLWYWPESCNPAPFNRWLGQKWFELFHGRNTVVTVTAGTGLGAGTTAVVASYKMPKNPAGDATMAAKAVRVGGAGLILLSGAAAALEIYETWDVAQGIVAPIQSGAGQWNGRVNDNGLRRVGAPQDLPDDYPGYPRKKK